MLRHGLHGESASKHLLLETLIHPFKVLGIALPWSALALYGLWSSAKEPTGLSRRFLQRAFLQYSLWSWALLGTLMMTIFPDHNIRQSFSLVPAWTLLGVLSLLPWLAATRSGARSKHIPRWATCTLILWCLVKIAYVEAIIPARFAHRPSLTSQAAIMQQFVPPDATLYLSRVKDECLMFNYGRTVKRVATWENLPSTSNCWCIMTEAERAATKLNILHERRLLDAQGEPLVLVCTHHAPS